MAVISMASSELVTAYNTWFDKWMHAVDDHVKKAVDKQLYSVAEELVARAIAGDTIAREWLENTAKDEGF